MRVRKSPGSAVTARVAIWFCLLTAFAGPLLAPAAMTVEPRLLGWPFFYWYQFLWVPLSAILLVCAYVLGRRGRQPDSPQRQGG